MDNRFTPAPLWKRLFSIVYDFLILAAISLAYFGVATAVSTLVFHHAPSEFKPNASGLWVQTGWVLTLLTFYCYFWIKIGQTVAMKAWRLKLVCDDKSELKLGHCLLRCFLGGLALGAFGLGYLWALIDKDKKALHDRLTKTSIIQLDREHS